MLLSTDNLLLTELSTMCRQELSRLIDPVHPLGRDWALFALNIGLDSKVQVFDNGPTSPFLALLDTWATVQPPPTIGNNQSLLSSYLITNHNFSIIYQCILHRCIN